MEEPAGLGGCVPSRAGVVRKIEGLVSESI